MRSGKTIKRATPGAPRGQVLGRGILALLVPFFIAAPLVAEEGFTPPTPLTIPTILYPEGFSEAVSGAVLLRFTITEEGTVTDPVALSATDPRFIPPALEAILKARFSPATRYGKPISLVVETTLEIPAPPPPPVYGILKGTIYKRGSRDPLEGVEIRAQTQGGEAVTASNAQGSFSLTLPPGEVTVVVYAPGFELLRVRELVEPGKEVAVEYRLTPTSLNTLEVVIEGERPRREVSRITLKTQEIRAVPGTLDDVLRVAQKLPGVATPNELSGQLLIRGSDNRDNRVYVDDMPMLLLYHFGALKSVIASELIQDVNLYPSNFSVRYGDAIGGILEVRLRDPRPERWQGRVMVSSILSEGVVETPVGENSAVLLAGRRSYLDLFFRQIFPEEQAGLSPVVVPWFYDYQGRFVHYQGAWTLRATLLGAKDRFEFVIPPERNLVPQFLSGLDLSSEEHSQSLRSTYALPGVTHETTLGIRESRQRFQASSDQFFELKTIRIVARHETLVELHPRWQVRGGVDLNLLYPGVEFSLPRPPRPGEFDYDFFTAPLSAASVTYRVDREGLYGSLRHEGREGWFELGVRGDRDGRSSIATADPRLTGGFFLGTLGELRLGAGIFHQFAQLQENAPIVGESRVGPNRGVHLLLGWQRRLGEELEGKVETFYKFLDRVIVANQDPLSPVRYSNRGKGRAYGVEFTLLKPLTGELFGWFNYSFVRSFRTDLTGKEEPFRFDQPHIVNFVLSYYPSVHWEFGTALRYTSGNPIPTILDRFYYGDSGFYLPLQENRGERLPPYFRLDARVKYTWIFSTWNLALLLEVLNTTMHENVLGVSYNRDYTQRSFIQSFPILPYLGVEARF